MVNFAFNPTPLTINQGDTVVWTNNADGIYHDTVGEGVWSSALLAPGQSFSFQFNTPGVYDYYCTPHRALMTGRIIVQAAGTVPATLSARLFLPRIANPATPTATAVAGPPVVAGASVRFTGAVYGAHLSGIVTASAWRY